MEKTIYEQTKNAITELCKIAKLKKGDIVIIGYDGLIMETYPAQIHADSWYLAE